MGFRPVFGGIYTINMQKGELTFCVARLRQGLAFQGSRKPSEAGPLQAGMDTPPFI